jgi:hypothetical protein
MQPIGLGSVLHDKQTSVFQNKRNGLLVSLVFERELARGAKTYRSDCRVPAEFFFIVAVPNHAFGPVVIEIEQTGIEPQIATFFNYVFYAF